MATESEARAQLAAWEQASLDLAAGRAVEIEGRSITRSDGDEVLRMIRHWRGVLNRIARQRSGRRGFPGARRADMDC